jgi:hypothetical protein
MYAYIHDVIHFYICIFIDSYFFLLVWLTSLSSHLELANELSQARLLAHL